MARKQVNRKNKKNNQEVLHFGDKVYLYVSLLPGDDATVLPCRGVAIDKLSYNKYKIALTEVFSSNLTGKKIHGADKLLGKKVNRTIDRLSKHNSMIFQRTTKDGHWISLNPTQVEAILSTRK